MRPELGFDPPYANWISTLEQHGREPNQLLLIAFLHRQMAAKLLTPRTARDENKADRCAIGRVRKQSSEHTALTLDPQQETEGGQEAAPSGHAWLHWIHCRSFVAHDTFLGL